MNERIKKYLDDLMQDAPKTRRVEEMRQELLAGCLDKYADLAAGGMDPESAYREVIDGIGDVHELLGHIERADAFDPVGAENKRRKRAFFTSAAICIYFIAVAIIPLMTEYFNEETIGMFLFFILCGIATMLLIYGRMTTVVKYEKAEDTLVEEIKVKMTKGRKESKMAGMASSSLWSFTVVLYIAVSFLTYRWDVTWILFVFASAVQCAISALFYPATRNRSISGAYWCLVVTLYFIISFWSFAWHITWIIFLLAVAGQQALRLFVYWREAE